MTDNNAALHHALQLDLVRALASYACDLSSLADAMEFEKARSVYPRTEREIAEKELNDFLDQAEKEVG